MIPLYPKPAWIYPMIYYQAVPVGLELTVQVTLLKKDAFTVLENLL